MNYNFAGSPELTSEALTTLLLSEVQDNNYLTSYCRVAPGGLKIEGNETFPTPSTTWGYSGGTLYHNGIVRELPTATGLAIPAGFSTTNFTIYVYLKDTGAFEYRAVAPSATDDLDEVCLGLLVSTDGGSTLFRVVPAVVDKSPITLNLLLTEGGVKIFSGYTFAPKPNTFEFTASSGKIISAGRNWFNTTPNGIQPHIVDALAADPVSLRFVTAGGSISAPTTIWPYDVENVAGGNTLGTLAGNNAGVWRIFVSGGGGPISALVLYPQVEYASIGQAITRWQSEAYTLPFELDGFVLAAVVIARGDVVPGNVANPQNVLVIPVGNSGIGSGSTTTLSTPVLLQTKTLTANAFNITLDEESLADYKRFQIKVSLKSATTQQLRLYVNNDLVDANYESIGTFVRNVSGTPGQAYTTGQSVPVLGFPLADTKTNYMIDADIFFDEFSCDYQGTYQQTPAAANNIGHHTGSIRKKTGTVSTLTSLRIGVPSGGGALTTGSTVSIYGIPT